MAQTNKEKLELIEKSKILNIKGGSAVIHFDEKGTIRKIEAHPLVYIDKIGFLNSDMV